MTGIEELLGTTLFSDVTVGSALGTVGAGAAGGALGNQLTKTSMPDVKPPPVMPSPDDRAVRDAQRRSIASQIARRGRQSTILTDPLGGSESKLGG